MTQHPDLSRSSVRHRTSRRTGMIGAVLLAGTLLIGSAAPPAPAAPHVPATRSVPVTLSTEGLLDVAVVNISHPIARPGDEVTITTKITNTTDSVVSGAMAQLTINYVAVTSRTEIAEWSAADLLDPVYSEPVQDTPTQKPLTRLAPGESTTVSFTYDPGAQKLQGFGARRLAIAVADTTGRLGVARTFLMYDADGVERDPMQLSVLAAVTGPATDPADPSAAEIELAQRVASGQRLDGVLQVAEHAGLSLAIDPNVMGVAAASEDPALTTWSERMLAAAEKTTTYTLPAHDPDLAALAHANVRSTGNRSFLRVPSTGDWQAPDTWHTDLAWPADGTAPDVKTLDLAVVAGRGNVVVGGDGLAYDGLGTVTGRADVKTTSGTARAIVSDTALTETFLAATDMSQAEMSQAEMASTQGDGAAATTASSAAEGTQRLLADTAAIVSQTPLDPPALSIVAPRSWTPSAEAATSILNTLDDAGWITTTTLDTLLGQEAQDVPRTALAQDRRAKAELGATEVAALENARDAVVTFSSVAGDDHVQISRPGITRLVAPLSVAHRQDPGLREQVVAQVLRSTNAVTHESVTVVPRQDINLITDVGDIPVRVRNGLDVDATVTVVLRPDHPRLTVDNRSTETVPAGQEMDVLVPVRAIGSGDVEVTAQVLTPTGAKFTEDSSFQVRVRAGWEEVGTWVAAGLVALLFLGGIWRTVRRGRSPYRATSKDIEEATGASGGEQGPAATESEDSVTVRAE